MEKKSPTYDLEAIKAAFSSADKLVITKTAFQTAQELGFQKLDIIATIQMIIRSHFYKSMTSDADHKVWQDVYHVPHDTAGELYVKFTSCDIGFLVLSFKAKEEF